MDATGWGVYSQVGWLFGGHSRTYRPKFGLWAPIASGDGHVFEVFGRFSLTEGDDDLNSSNQLQLATLGANWYFKKWRGGLNLIASETDRDLDDEDNGPGLIVRLQYLL